MFLSNDRDTLGMYAYTCSICDFLNERDTETISWRNELMTLAEATIFSSFRIQ